MYLCPCKKRDDEQARSNSDKNAKPATAFSPISKTTGYSSLAGAMQAQDYNYFRWTIGIRQRIPQIAQLQAAFAKAELLRLHLLRCTVQVVSQTDIGWLLPLCKERNLLPLQSWHKSINTSFSESHFQEITQALQELLAGGKSLPKKAIAEQLTSLGLLPDDRLLTSLLVRSEIEDSCVQG